MLSMLLNYANEYMLFTTSRVDYQRFALPLLSKTGARSQEQRTRSKEPGAKNHVPLRSPFPAIPSQVPFSSAVFRLALYLFISTNFLKVASALPESMLSLAISTHSSMLF